RVPIGPGSWHASLGHPAGDGGRRYPGGEGLGTEAALADADAAQPGEDAGEGVAGGTAGLDHGGGAGGNDEVAGLEFEAGRAVDALRAEEGEPGIGLDLDGPRWGRELKAPGVGHDDSTS